MLSRGEASAGAVGSTNALCGAKRARPSVLESKHFSNSISSAVPDVCSTCNPFADGVVEDKHPVGAGRGLDQPFRFRIVDSPDLVFAIEVFHRTFLLDQGKPLPIERYCFADRADVMNRQAVR